VTEALIAENVTDCESVIARRLSTEYFACILQTSYTVDHQILLDILECRFAITNAALAWFHSYLSDRSYCTYHWQYIERHRTGLWSASVLGSKTFIAYTQDIDSIFTQHGVHRHAFADDTQTYLTQCTNCGTAATELSKRHK